MFRKLIVVTAFATSVFAAEAAHADWLMVGAYDFQAYDRSTDYQFWGGRGGYVATGFTTVKAPVRIPIGKSFKSLYCQLLDTSAGRDVTVTLQELASSDTTSNFGGRTMMTLTTSGTPGHVKLGTMQTSGSTIARTFECPTTACNYYTYYLFATLPDTSNTHLKSCAIYYE